MVNEADDDRRTRKRSVVVFRERPKNQQEILSMDASCLPILSSKEIQAVPPITSHMYKASVRCHTDISQAFSFSRIFHTQTPQREVFKESMVPTLNDFFEGQNCLGVGKGKEYIRGG